MADGDLTTKAAVKVQMGTGATGADVQIDALIPPASTAICRFCREEFVGPEDPETRDVAIDPLCTGFASEVYIGAMREHPSAAKLVDVDGVEIQTLTMPGDLIALPIYRRADVDPITGFRLRSALSWPSDTRGALRITGLWGWPEIPTDVAQAAIVTVRSWLRSDSNSSAEYGNSDGGRVVQPAPAGGWMLPMAAKQLLASYRRPLVAVI